jgi:hypothetical protein
MYVALAGRYDNPIPTRFLAPIDYLKIPALCSLSIGSCIKSSLLNNLKMQLFEECATRYRELHLLSIKELDRKENILVVETRVWFCAKSIFGPLSPPPPPISGLDRQALRVPACRERKKKRLGKY